MTDKRKSMKKLKAQNYKVTDVLKVSSNMINLSNGYVYDTQEKELSLHGEVIQLRGKQIGILETLIKHKGSIVTFEMLAREVWEDPETNLSYIHIMIKQLKRELNYMLITHVRVVGYRIDF